MLASATRAGETPAVQQTLLSHGRGYVLHSRVDAATQTTLADLGFDVMLQEVSVVQPMGGSPVFAAHAARIEASHGVSMGGTAVAVSGTTLSWTVESTIHALFD